jgi:hypothetical protein
MATSQDPPAQASPGPGPGLDTAPIALPPPPPPPAADTAGPPPAGRGWDRFLTFLVLVFAFLAASFLARNSDLWFHLAAGRLLAHGSFTFGEDPFAYTTRGVYWANHAWLFDRLLYDLNARVGSAGLVVLKAVLVAALAGILLRVRRPDGAAWLAAVCTTLAVLAMSPRLLLQPACVSYFLLGLTLWLLWRPHAQPEGAGAGGRGLARTPLLLLLVFALWVNVDEWFLLGPVVAALFWLGERLQGERRTPGWLVPAGFAVCLLNPYTVHAFTLPPELAPVTWTSGLRLDARIQAQFASPWQPPHLHAAAGLNAAALAYFVLTFLGLLCFLAHPRARSGWRLLVWLPFALLAAWQARLIPFFAVVAAPITALNAQDILAARRAAASGVRRGTLAPLAGRLLLVMGLLALIALAWPGWLAGYGREDRRVAWGVQADPSLQRAAETLHDWRRRGLLRDQEQVFALSPEVAQYGAWFAPGERYFFDHRYPLFGTVARDYETVCRALGPRTVTDRPEPAGDWRRVLHDHGIGVVVFADREPQRLRAVLHRLAGDREHWTLLSVSGEGLVAGWNEAREPGAFAPLAFNAGRLAFGPQDETARRELPGAPESGPELPPSRRTLWARLTRPPAALSWESPAANVYLRDFDESQEAQARQRLHRGLVGYAASLAGLPALGPAAPQATLQLAAAHQVLWSRDPAGSFLVRDQLGPYFAQLLDRSPALPLLAVRAARRAVAADPEDANAWLRLGEAYVLLRDLTCERSREGLLPPLAQLRHVQIATALEQALRLDPDLEAAHQELAYLYGAQNSLDLALEHRRQELRLARRGGPRAGETAEDYAYRLDLLERDTTRLDEYVQARRKDYPSAVRTAQGERAAQARSALSLGLARKAVEEVLLPAPPDVLGPAGMRMELELLLALGRAEDVRSILGDARALAGKKGLGYYDIPARKMTGEGSPPPVPYHWPAYEWLRVLQAGATGDYAEAREDLRTIRAGLRAGHDRLQAQLRDLEYGELGLMPGLFAGPPPFLPAFTARTIHRLHEQRTALQAGEPLLRTHEADLCVLEGLLALEQGDTEDARLAFTMAQQLGEPPAAAAVRFAGAAIAADYLPRLKGPEAPGGF